MSFDFVVAPGTILKEYVENRNIGQKELAKQTNSSERHISNIINSKVKLSEEFALKLEDVFPDVKAEFWKDLESYYQIKQASSKQE
jgi:HTH-type transcriptional regulator/antitoxin HigA